MITRRGEHFCFDTHKTSICNIIKNFNLKNLLYSQRDIRGVIKPIHPYKVYQYIRNMINEKMKKNIKGIFYYILFPIFIIIRISNRISNLQSILKSNYIYHLVQLLHELVIPMH